MLPNHRWHINSADPDLAKRLAEELERMSGVETSPVIASVLASRGFQTAAAAAAFIHPERCLLPSPLAEFPDLAKSIELLEEAIVFGRKIAICGDYDADGMTSTALLLRALRALGADVDYAIPSRMHDGYGINQRIVEEFHAEGVKLILTVDNGISAYDPIVRAMELDLQVIITDHHDLPERLPPATAILNPKLLPPTSVYAGIAGVGVAYILAVALAESLQEVSLADSLLELFTIGTIADLAPLVGVNRQWVKAGLNLLPNSQIQGVVALLEVSGTDSNKQGLKPADIGFKIGPRINAIGRLGDPQIVIDLLTTEDYNIALEKATICEGVNRQRQELCKEIETAAVAAIEAGEVTFREERVLTIVRPNWHHGTIGIVASRLVERYGVPVFIGTYEADGSIRGSARGIPEFDVFKALEYCDPLLAKYGGHRGAGGFSMEANLLDSFRDCLSEFARKSLEIEHLRPLVKIDTIADLAELDLTVYDRIDAIHPCGIENPDPVFWTPEVTISEQKIVGKEHLKFIVHHERLGACAIKAIAWRFGIYYPLPKCVDIAYKLRDNIWGNRRTLELEVVSVRLPVVAGASTGYFSHDDRRYHTTLSADGNLLTIANDRGQILTITKGERTGSILTPDGNSRSVNVTEPSYFQLIIAAKKCWER